MGHAGGLTLLTYAYIRTCVCMFVEWSKTYHNYCQQSVNDDGIACTCVCLFTILCAVNTALLPC